MTGSLPCWNQDCELVSQLPNLYFNLFREYYQAFFRHYYIIFKMENFFCTFFYRNMSKKVERLFLWDLPGNVKIYVKFDIEMTKIH